MTYVCGLCVFFKQKIGAKYDANVILIDTVVITSFNFDADIFDALQYKENNFDATDSFTVQYCCLQTYSMAFVCVCVCVCVIVCAIK